MFAARDITVRTATRTLLDGVTFEAELGEVVAIIGPNGAGKTTLLEAVAGLDRRSSAVVSIGGHELSTFADRARAIAYLPDSSEPPAEVSVRTLVDHCLRRRPRAPDMVEELDNAFTIGKLMDEPCGTLSRGERQRVSLFCALAISRPVVLLDEPFGVFDPLQLRGVLTAVRRVAASGAAVVAAVHQLGDAERIADRVLLLSEGRRIAWGAPAVLREQAALPQGSLEDVFVALLERGRGAS